jgi:hypothetical protein
MKRWHAAPILGMVIAMSATHAQSPDVTNEASGDSIFWSGHSLTAPPIPDFVAEISARFGTPSSWNQHSMAGASLEMRTRGNPPAPTGWRGYQQGLNRDTENMDVIEELRGHHSVGGEPYGALVVTENHSFMWILLRGDTVRYLRHYHERYLEGNPAGQTYFYQAWLGVNDKSAPQSWIEYERAASPAWQCVATRVNMSLAAEGRSDRIASLPAGLALTELVARATSAAGLPGISGPSTQATMDRIFSDDVHLTRLGAYYVALVSYAFIRDHTLDGAWHPVDIEPEQAIILQQTASDFVSDYKANNTPLELAECNAYIREHFAAHYWRYDFDRPQEASTSWWRSIIDNSKRTARRLRLIREWQRSFADDAVENPLRFDPLTDQSFWFPAP